MRARLDCGNFLSGQLFREPQAGWHRVLWKDRIVKIERPLQVVEVQWSTERCGKRVHGEVVDKFGPRSLPMVPGVKADPNALGLVVPVDDQLWGYRNIRPQLAFAAAPALAELSDRIKRNEPSKERFPK